MASPAPAKSQPLHNFSLPHLKWRNHRTGRNKLAGDTSSSSSPPHHQSSAYVSRRSESESDQNGVVRIINPSKKMLTKVIKPTDNSKGKRTNNNKICIRIRKNDVKHDVTEVNQQNGVVQSIEEEEEDTSPKIWNLRPRRPLISHKHNNISSLTLPENRYYYSHECNNNNNNENQTNKEVLELGKTKSNENSMQMTSRKKHNNKLSISLSKDEIEEDIFLLTGAKPSRRPKKRTRTIQRQLDSVFPGLWLGSITADTYKVSEARSKV